VDVMAWGGVPGVGIGETNRQAVKGLKSPTSSGLLVTGVEKSGPGAKAGLAEGDIVTAINGTQVKTGDALRNMIAMNRPGTQIELEVMHHDGKSATVKAKLGELPDETAQMQQMQQMQLQRRGMQPSQKRKPQVRRWTWQSP